jgi:outer membrane receptor for ferrienterochelin and colicins
MADKQIALLAVVSILASTVAQAQQAAGKEEDLMLLYENEEMISIATGTSKPYHLAPSVASVITAREIKAMGARDLDEVLEFVPGLHVSRSSTRLNAIYSFRGIHTGENPQALLLINGIPIVNIVSGGRPASYRLPVEDISRIEVIRGPGSAVYGADAFSGVINVITKDADELKEGNVGLRTGSFNSRDGWVQHGGTHAGWDTAFSLEYSKNDGDQGRIVSPDASGATVPLQSQFELYNLNLTLDRNHWNVWFNSWATDNAGLGAGAVNIIDPVGGQDSSLNLIKVSYTDDKFSDDWGLDSYVSYIKQDNQPTFRLYPPSSKLPICSDGGANAGNIYVPGTCTSFNLVTFTDGVWAMPGGKSEESAFEAALTYRGSVTHLARLAVGVKYTSLTANESKNFGPGVIDGTVSPVDMSFIKDITGTGNIYLPDTSRNVRYFSLQDEWQFAPDWELTGGVRYDNYSDFGDTVNPRLAVVWATRYNLTSKLLYGRAFRAPSFKELYFDNNPVQHGNADLKPETIDMLELAFDYRPTFDLQTRMNLFTYRIADLIEFNKATTFAENSKDQRGHGIELDVEWKMTEKFKLMGNFAWQSSEDTNTNKSIADAPGRQLSILAQYRPTPTWSLGAQTNTVMDRQRAPSDTRPAIADYTTADVTVRHDSGRSPWQVAVSVRNIFDKDAREPAAPTLTNDIPLTGRSAYLEASYQFGGK